jgi:hypothetical protein
VHHVFLSYAREDTAFVGAVAEALKTRGVPAWVDTSDLPLSLPWLDLIGDAIQESALVVRFESAARRASKACAAEDETARALGRPLCSVLVDDDLDATVRRILAGLPAGPRDRAVVELAVRARDWDRAGRPARHLVGRRARRKLETGRRADQDSALERSFLRECRRRSRRRAQFLALGVVLTVAAAATVRVFFGAQAVVAEQNQELVEGLHETNVAMQQLGIDQYEDLQEAAELGSDESAMHALRLVSTLARPTPDDAFSVGGAPVGFATEPVGPVVQVHDQNGGWWTRDAAAVDQRHGEAASAPATVAAAVAHGVAVDTATGAVTAERGGVLHRRMHVPGATPAAASSPDGRWLAVGTVSGVVVVDVESGRVRLTTTGAPAPVTAVTWTADGDRVWAVAGSTILSWPFGESREVLDRPGEWLSAVFPSLVEGTVWVATRKGLLQQISVADGAVVAEIDLGTMILSGSANESGSAAVLIGEESAFFVDLPSSRVTTIDLGNCSAARPAVTAGGDLAYVPCRYAGTVVLRIDDTAIADTFDPLPERGVQAVTLGPDGELVLADSRGALYRWSGAGDPEQVAGDGCAQRVEEIAASERGHLYAVGVGTGRFGCALLGSPQEDGYFWSNLADDAGSTTALATAYTQDAGAFATGYFSGVVVLRTTDAIAPERVVLDVSGNVRDMVTVGDHLYVATSAGVLAEIDWCTSCLTNAHLARVAGDRLERARVLGLTSLSPG